MNKKNNNKGFTLAELLIVVAIIAVLVAIAIPVFSRQLESSREGTDAANIRSEYALVMTDVLMSNGTKFTGEHKVNFKQTQDDWQNKDVSAGIQALSKAGSQDGDTDVAVTGTPHSGGSVEFSYSPASGATKGKVTIQIS